MAVAAEGAVLCGRYEVRAPVGRTILGGLYRAIDRQVQVEVLLLVVEHQSEHRSEHDAGIAPEARILFDRRAGRLPLLPQHAGLLRTYAVTREQLTDVVAVQWAQGTSLREVIDRARQRSLKDGQAALAPAEQATLLGQIGAALGHLHAHGILVGDLCPEHIAVYDGPPRTAKLLFAGIGSSLVEAELARRVRRSYVEPYAAPEVRNGRGAGGATFDERADVFSLATLAVELSGGVRPERGMQSLQHVPPAVGGAVVAGAVGKCRASPDVGGDVHPRADGGHRRPAGAASAPRVSAVLDQARAQD